MQWTVEGDKYVRLKKMKLELSELIIFVFIYLHIICSIAKENEPLVAVYSEIMKSLSECRYLKWCLVIWLSVLNLGVCSVAFILDNLNDWILRPSVRFFFFFYSWIYRYRYLCVCVKKGGLFIYPWLAWNLVCTPGWPWIHGSPPDSAFQVLGLYVGTAIRT